MSTGQEPISSGVVPSDRAPPVREREPGLRVYETLLFDEFQVIAGNDAIAAVLTDIGDTAWAFNAEQDLAFTDLLYVAITRARYRCVVLTSD